MRVFLQMYSRPQPRFCRNQSSLLIEYVFCLYLFGCYMILFGYWVYSMLKRAKCLKYFIIRNKINFVHLHENILCKFPCSHKRNTLVYFQKHYIGYDMALRSLSPQCFILYSCLFSSNFWAKVSSKMYLVHNNCSLHNKHNTVLFSFPIYNLYSLQKWHGPKYYSWTRS